MDPVTVIFSRPDRYERWCSGAPHYAELCASGISYYLDIPASVLSFVAVFTAEEPEGDYFEINEDGNNIVEVTDQDGDSGSPELYEGAETLINTLSKQGYEYIQVRYRAPD